MASCIQSYNAAYDQWQQSGGGGGGPFGGCGDPYGGGGDPFGGGPPAPTPCPTTNPSGISFDSNGNFYVSDSGTNVVWYYDYSTNSLSPFAGDGSNFASGSSGNGGPAGQVSA